MASAEGRREIEAARKRLAAAQAQAASAATNLEVANETKVAVSRAMEAATKNADAAESQVQCTQKELDEAKQFLKEAEQRWEVIDVDSDNEPRSSKRRKVSLSSEPPSSTSSSNRPGKGQVDQIVVEGCGYANANGIYIRDGEHKGAPLFRRSVGADDVYTIHRGSPVADNWWYISKRQSGQSLSELYGLFSNSKVLPPKSGWLVFHGGISPAPKLNW